MFDPDQSLRKKRLAGQWDFPSLHSNANVLGCAGCMCCAGDGMALRAARQAPARLSVCAMICFQIDTSSVTMYSAVTRPFVTLKWLMPIT